MEAFKNLLTTPGQRRGLNVRARHVDGHFIRVELSAVNHLEDKIVSAIVLQGEVVADSNVSSHESRIYSSSQFMVRLADAVTLATH